jgi:hypothetical protein
LKNKRILRISEVSKVCSINGQDSFSSIWKKGSNRQPSFIFIYFKNGSNQKSRFIFGCSEVGADQWPGLISGVWEMVQANN